MSHADMSATVDAPERVLKGWHVLLIMLAFFGVMFAVNGVFLYHAITSFPGEDVKKSYVQGLNYNATLADRAVQSELGWTAEAGLADNAVIFRLNDADGQALTGHVVVGELRRLATGREDRSLVFQARGNGDYASDVSALGAGQWRLQVRVYDADRQTLIFQSDKTLIVS
jgi:nitrogen fixation protein FixH